MVWSLFCRLIVVRSVFRNEVDVIVEVCLGVCWGFGFCLEREGEGEVKEKGEERFFEVLEISDGRREGEGEGVAERWELLRKFPGHRP